MSRKARERLSRRENNVERRDKMLIHDFSADRATMEEVFDKSTLMVIYNLMNAGVIDELHGVVSAGKEARVYWGKTKEGKELAVKIYLTSSADFKKGIQKYIEGDFRFKSVKRDTRSLIFTWAQKEFRNLEQAAKAKVRVPKPVIVKNNVLIMEFIGENGESAPSLKEQSPDNPEKVYKALLIYMERLYRKGDLVHGDLSEYNIILKPDMHVLIIDWPQYVTTDHSNAQELLERDVQNVLHYFRRKHMLKAGLKEALEYVTGSCRTLAL
jgi:RIO kinase 1